MAIYKTQSEMVELAEGGELQVYGASSARIALSFSKNDLEACIWISAEEAQEFADKINKLLTEQ